MISEKELADKSWDIVERRLIEYGESKEFITKLRHYYIEAFLDGAKTGRNLYGREMNGENV